MENFLQITTYDQKIDALGREIAESNRCVNVIRGLIKESEENTEIFKTFDEFFYFVYQASYEKLYAGISRLQDNTKSTSSIFKMLETSSIRSALKKRIKKRIKDTPVAEKIKNFRDNFLSHSNERLILDENSRKSFLAENKTTIEEIEAYLNLLGEAMTILSQEASFQPLALPYSNIRMQINNIFERLSQSKLSSESGSNFSMSFYIQKKLLQLFYLFRFFMRRFSLCKKKFKKHQK